MPGRRRLLVGFATWIVVVFGGSFGMHVLAPFQPIGVTTGIVLALALVLPILAMRFFPVDQIHTLKSHASYVITSLMFAALPAIALYDHWHDQLAIANDSDEPVVVEVDGHELGALGARATGTYKIPSNASDIVAHHGSAVVDRDTFDGVPGAGMWVFDVGGRGCFERRTVTYGSSMFSAFGGRAATPLALATGHHLLRVDADFAWHADTGVSVSKGESSATRTVVERCGSSY